MMTSLILKFVESLKADIYVCLKEDICLSSDKKNYSRCCNIAYNSFPDNL